MRLMWTPQEEQVLRDLLPVATSVHDLAVMVSNKIGRRITYSAVHNKLSALGLTGVRSPLGRGPQHAAPPPTPEIPVHIDPADWEEDEPTGPHEPSSRVKDRDTDRAPAPTPEPADEHGLGAYKLREQVRGLNIAKKRLLEELRDRDAQIEILGCLRGTPSPPIVARRGVGSGKRRQGVPCMVLSDLHVEEHVRPETVAGLNEYTLDIADTCIARCAEAFAWLSTDQRYDCREGILSIIGDTFSGYIHEELVQQNFLSPVQAVVWLQERLERMIRQILATTNFELLRIVCNDGNHGRLTHKMRVATRTANSLEWLMFKTLAARFAKEPRVSFQIAEGEWNYVDVYDTTIGYTHGDSFRYQGGIGGLLIPLRRGFNEMKKYRKCDVMVCGHFHERIDTEILVNGSMIGISPYSMHIHAKPEPRQQSFFMVDSVHGKCLSAPIWLPKYEGTPQVDPAELFATPATEVAS